MHSLISPSIVWLISILMAVGFAGMQVKDRDGTQSVLRRCNECINGVIKGTDFMTLQCV